MLDKLLKIKAEYEDVQNQLSQPDVASDPEKLKKLSIKLKELENAKDLAINYEKALNQIKDAEEMLKTEKDEEMVEMAKEQLDEGKKARDELEEQVKIELLPKDPNDGKNCIIEVRAGAGGEESSLFGAELSRMYFRYAERVGFKTELISKSENPNGGVKEMIFRMIGEGAYGRMK